MGSCLEFLIFGSIPELLGRAIEKLKIQDTTPQTPPTANRQLLSLFDLVDADGGELGLQVHFRPSAPHRGFQHLVLALAAPAGMGSLMGVGGANPSPPL